MTPGNGDKTISDLPTLQGIDTVASNMSDSTGSADTELRGSGEARYSMGAELARGGMGSVMIAKDLNLRRDVAMKVVLRPDAVGNDQIARFVHEAQVTGQLEHPSIVPVYELGVDANDQVYYTMKHIHGTNLGDVLKGIRHGDAEMQAAYPLPRLLNIFIKACDALAFSHAREVIHRDLKPDNIMVGDFGEVLVVDWGLAKILGEQDKPVTTTANAKGEALLDSERSDQTTHGSVTGNAMHTMDGAIMGTPAYMAPEQAGGDLERTKLPADIYAMGAILYAILTLEAPYSGSNVDEILGKVREGNFVPPSDHKGPHPHCTNDTIPASLSAVVMKAMATEPENRYASVADLQADVQAYIDGFATSAEGANLLRLAKLFIARHRALCASFVVANLLLIGVVTIAFAVNARARNDADEARAQAEQARADALRARETANVARDEAEVARGEAVATLRAVTNEQERGKAVRSKAAPAMVRAGYRLATQGDMEGAALQAELACEYD